MGKTRKYSPNPGEETRPLYVTRRELGHQRSMFQQVCIAMIDLFEQVSPELLVVQFLSAYRREMPFCHMRRYCESVRVREDCDNKILEYLNVRSEIYLRSSEDLGSFNYHISPKP